MGLVYLNINEVKTLLNESSDLYMSLIGHKMHYLYRVQNKTLDEDVLNYVQGDLKDAKKFLELTELALDVFNLYKSHFSESSTPLSPTIQ